MRMFLALDPDLDVVGEAADGAEAISFARALTPDVVLMDLELARRCCVAAAAAVHSARPELPVVLLCLRDDIETKARARSAGAAALVAKHELEPLVRTIRDVVARR
ncbi:MAG: response regulator [Pseudonocardiales bacterium]|nr:response regulator [Pseudonocardiales bacterium]